jgi:hypothetical protein
MTDWRMDDLKEKVMNNKEEFRQTKHSFSVMSDTSEFEKLGFSFDNFDNAGFGPP